MSNPSNRITPGTNHGQQPASKLTPLALLSNSKTPEHTAPLTSLDWNTVSPSLIITSSIDTTCTIWDIPTLTAKTQLIAHDKEVFDVRFCANSVDVFVSCGADGSVRMFDLRSLEHSTIIYEPSVKDDKGMLLPFPTPTFQPSPTERWEGLRPNSFFSALILHFGASADTCRSELGFWEDKSYIGAADNDLFPSLTASCCFPA